MRAAPISSSPPRSARGRKSLPTAISMSTARSGAAPSPVPAATSMLESSAAGSRPSWSALPVTISSANSCRRSNKASRYRSRSSMVGWPLRGIDAHHRDGAGWRQGPQMAVRVMVRRRKGEVFLAGKVIVLTSGKGGVGKTTSAAAIASGLALRGHRTVVIDFDVGLRNLDLIMGCERRVVFDFINVINGDARLNQALIKDKRNDNLYIFPTSQTRDKEALKRDGVERVLDELKENFDYIVCDSPAGIEHGAITALYFADEAIIVTNPEVSSVRDSDRIIGILASKSRRAEHNLAPVAVHLLLTRYSPERVEKGEMLAIEDVNEILSIPLLGVIPESESVLRASNTGTPVVFDDESPAGQAYHDAVGRLLGEQRELRFLRPERRGFFRSLFGRA